MLLGGWRALRQFDIKLLLAYGTVSQLGFLLVVVSIGTRAAALAGLAMLIAHALFKAALFLVVGIVDHQTGTRDLRELSGVGRSAPVLAGRRAARRRLDGRPAAAGRVRRQGERLRRPDRRRSSRRRDRPRTAWPAGPCWSGWCSARRSPSPTRPGSCGARFATKPGVEPLRARADPGRVPGRAGPAAASSLRARASWAGRRPRCSRRTPTSSRPAGTHAELALWHGPGLALVLSLVSLGAGLLLFWRRAVVRRRCSRALGPRWSAERGYFGLDAAGWTAPPSRSPASPSAARWRRTSSVILVVVVLLPGSALLAAADGPTDVVGWDNAGAAGGRRRSSRSPRCSPPGPGAGSRRSSWSASPATAPPCCSSCTAPPTWR